MSEQVSARKAHREFVASSALETSLPQSSNPLEGVRLVRAFLRISDPGVRSVILQMVETMGSASVGG